MGKSRRRSARPAGIQPVSEATPDPGRVEPWLRAHRNLMLGLFIGLSILLRWGYFTELSQGPCLVAHRWTESDMNFFDQWARTIAGGDWLVDRPLHPYFRWQATAAESYFRMHPEQIAVYERSGVPAGNREALYRELWNHWLHGKEYHQEPLYPYLVAITYRLFGPDVRWVFAWQMLLGVFANLLVYGLARRYFGEVAGVAAAVLVLFYSPLFFYELTLLRTTLTAFLGLALVAVAQWALDAESWRRWFAAGLAFGVSMLCQSTFALVFAGCLAMLRVRRGIDLRSTLRRSGAALAGAVLAVSPVMLRNAVVGVPITAWAANGAQTILMFGGASFDPFHGGSVPVAPNQVRILGDTGGKLAPVALATLHDHGSVWSVARLALLKFAKLWNWYEEPDNQNFYYYRLHSAVLRYAPFTSLVLAPLILAGLVLAAPRWKQAAPLYLLALTGIVICVLTYSFSRYRVQYFAAMIPLAALTIVRAVEWIGARRYRRLLALAGGLAAALIVTAQPLPAGRTPIRLADYTSPYTYYWIPLHDEAMARQDWRAAAAIVDGSLRYEPPEMRELGPSRKARTEDERQLASLYAVLHSALADDLRRAGDTGGAARELNRAAALEAASRAAG